MASRFCIAIAMVLVQGALALEVRANHFEIAMTLSDGTNKQEANTQTEPPPKPGPAAVRPVLQVPFGDKCTASWKLTSNSKETLKDVLVHFYVVRIERAGQDPPPLEPSQVVIESAQTIDLAYHDTTSAALQFTPDRPGIYLCRVETQGSADPKGHEHFAAIELTVKPKP
jgi:hypothetical protein